MLDDAYSTVVQELRVFVDACGRAVAQVFAGFNPEEPGRDVSISIIPVVVMAAWADQCMINCFV
jgi:hypothetical protein